MLSVKESFDQIRRQKSSSGGVASAQLAMVVSLLSAPETLCAKYATMKAWKHFTRKMYEAKPNSDQSGWRQRASC
jgi:hypothetical protein